MAEFVQKKLEDMRPILEQMEKLELFNSKEIRDITKKWKDHEYKLQRRQKSKEDYVHYIQYQMQLMKLIKQRREKFGVTKQKCDIDFAMANKINHLYKEALFRYQSDTRFWLAYISFCKQVKFNSQVKRMLGKMLSVQQTKAKFWHIAARWEVEENNDPETAKLLLYRALLFHPDSQLLYTDLIKLELDDVLVRNKKSDSEKEHESMNNPNNSEIPAELQSVFIIYKQAIIKIKDVKFLINLLNIIQTYENTEKLQAEILNDIVKDYPHEPLMWDTMAKRELEGLVQPSLCNEENSIENYDKESTSLRGRIQNCHQVYQVAVRKLKSKEIWSFFIDCMIFINQDLSTLPNLKRKLLKNALKQGHEARKLQEKHYLNWIDMLNAGTNDKNVENTLYEVHCWATDALPESENLWRSRLYFLYKTNQNDLAVETFNKGEKILGENSLSLWKLKLLHVKSKHPEKLNEFFQEALKSKACVRNFIKPIYVEHLALTKDIHEVRKAYDKLYLELPQCLELHRKMINLEINQTKVTPQCVRKIYEIMTFQFGKDNIDVWLEFMSFEMKHGDVEKVTIIYQRAVKTLKANLVDNFVTKYSLIKTNPIMI